MNGRDVPNPAPDGGSDSDSAPPDMDASALFRAHAPFVAGFVRKLGLADHEVPDVVQDVFLIAHKKGGYRSGPARPSTWLAGIALGEVRNRKRKAARRGAVASNTEAVERASGTGASSPERQVAASREMARVGRALDALDEDKRVVFMLYEIEGESCASIAAGLGIATGTVYSRLHAARKTFKRSFEEPDA